MSRGALFAVVLAGSSLLLATACGVSREANPAPPGAPGPQPAPAPAPAPAPTPPPARTAGLRVADDLAQRVVQIPGIRAATVLVSGDTAYVAVDQGTTQGQPAPPGRIAPGQPQPAPSPSGGTTYGQTDVAVSDQLKRRVTEVIQQADPSIRVVRVSANPAVLQRFRTFSQDLQSGRPIGGLADQFRAFVERLWPTPHS
ncbi:MAG: YhcN/YlaJ family sporulation lipoprotein [Alicyclobacillaceae bacterium]|nr:YhcN/YlaJ family sporulation lipoprotein [Alicyclobacillaceae bacterium]